MLPDLFTSVLGTWSGYLYGAALCGILELLLPAERQSRWSWLRGMLFTFVSLAAAVAADLPVTGLMCVPPLEIEAAPYFALLAKLARDHGVTGLSMGMSGDFKAAVMLGASAVRVGTALFED